MGILAGFYLVFTLDRYAAGWLPFVDVLRALWWLIV
jgi:hypothetical protein